VFNFHPTGSQTDYLIEAPLGKYKMVFDSDAAEYGGHGRLVADQFHFTLAEKTKDPGQQCLSLYLPNRTVLVLRQV